MDERKTVESFCKQNQNDFSRYLHGFAADKILLSPVAWFIAIPLVVLSILNGLKYGLIAGLAYIPVLVIFLLFKVLFELGLPVKRRAILWIDALVLGVFLGFNFILWLAARDNKLGQISSNGSLAMILVMVNFMTLNRSFRSMAFKTLIYFLCEATYLYLLEKNLLILFKMEIIFGLSLSLATGYLKNQVFRLYFYHTETGSASLMHAYRQLQKVVFPHQLDLMKIGYTLEESMPVGSGEAAVICYDIQASSQLPQAELNQFIQKIMERCHDLFSSGYSRNPLQVTAFKLKEVGDGFICTVGFPFAHPGPLSLYDTAIHVALECQKITKQVRVEMGMKSGYCSIGIASGRVHSFYTRVGIKVYDVYGSPLVMARRYEEFRKQYQHMELVPVGDIVSVQSKTLEACSADQQKKFIRIQLEALKLKVRDDASARHVYLAVFPEDANLSPLRKAS